jgi:hypothetical protein
MGVASPYWTWLGSDPVWLVSRTSQSYLPQSDASAASAALRKNSALPVVRGLNEHHLTSITLPSSSPDASTASRHRTVLNRRCVTCYNEQMHAYGTFQASERQKANSDLE